jgi:DNA (cytosine-5)-methyltransferase 1
MTVIAGGRRRSQRSQEASLRVADLFAGAGGLSQGFLQAGYEIVAASDVDPDAAATFSTNFPDAALIVGDVREPAIREQIRAAVRGVDVLVGGPPCQAFSQVRNHARIIDDPRNSLYREFVGILADSLPLAFLVENVPGMAQMGVQQQVVQDLGLDGEYVVSPQLVDAADFGVPQTRKRLLFIGVRRSLGIPPPLLVGSGATSILQLTRTAVDGGPTAYAVRARGRDGENLADQLADPSDLTCVSVEQAIGDLRCLSMGRREDALSSPLAPATSAYQSLMRDGAMLAGLTNVSVPRSQDDTVLRLSEIPAGGNHRDLPDALLNRYLTGQKWGPHNGTDRLSRRHYYAYRRLHPDIWAWTLNTKGDSVYHYSEARCLSVREFARLQSFPDQFQFTTDPRPGRLFGRIDGGATHSRYRQAGNAVPPLLAAAAAQGIAASLRAPVTARSA